MNDVSKRFGSNKIGSESTARQTIASWRTPTLVIGFGSLIALIAEKAQRRARPERADGRIRLATDAGDLRREHAGGAAAVAGIGDAAGRRTRRTIAIAWQS